MNKKLDLPLPFYFVIIMVFFFSFFLLELGILKPILNRIREKGRYDKYVEVCWIEVLLGSCQAFMAHKSFLKK